MKKIQGEDGEMKAEILEKNKSEKKAIVKCYASQVLIKLPKKFDVTRNTNKLRLGTADTSVAGERFRSVTPLMVSEQDPLTKQIKSTYKEQVKARQYLIKRNIVKKRETFNRPLKKGETTAAECS